mgnify:CR=1 FL=1
MNYLRTMKDLLISLILSPVIIYIILGIAKAFGATYSMRSEERRVGKECRSRWSREH